MFTPESNPKRRNRLVIYDFDGTIFRSPDREEGSMAFYEATGNRWPHQGWWGRIETLTPPVIPDPIPEEMWIQETLDFHQKDIEDENSFVVLMTGRPYKVRRRVREILDSKNILFHREYYRGMPGQKGRDTFDIKVNIMEEDLFHDALNILEIHEDRQEHLSAFMTKAKRWKSLMSKHLEKIIIRDVPNNVYYEF